MNRAWFSNKSEFKSRSDATRECFLGHVICSSSIFRSKVRLRMKASLIEMRICEGLLVSLGLAACIGGLAFTVPQLTEATYARVKVRVEK